MKLSRYFQEKLSETIRYKRGEGGTGGRKGGGDGNGVAAKRNDGEGDSGEFGEAVYCRRHTGKSQVLFDKNEKMTINEEASQAKVSESDNGKIDPRASSTTGDASYISIAEIFDFVKRNGGKFESGSKNPVYFNPKPVNPAFLNEDGMPKVFYHGTDEEWTTDDRRPTTYDIFKNVNQCGEKEFS